MEKEVLNVAEEAVAVVPVSMNKTLIIGSVVVGTVATLLLFPKLAKGIKKLFRKKGNTETASEEQSTTQE